MAKELSKLICDKCKIGSIDFSLPENFVKLYELPIESRTTLGHVITDNCGIDNRLDFLKAFYEYVIDVNKDYVYVLRLFHDETRARIIEDIKNTEWKTWTIMP